MTRKHHQIGIPILNKIKLRDNIIKYTCFEENVYLQIIRSKARIWTREYTQST